MCAPLWAAGSLQAGRHLASGGTPAARRTTATPARSHLHASSQFSEVATPMPAEHTPAE
jgi:hypothetical protein